MARRRSSGRSNGGWMRFFSFVAIMLLGLALMLSLVIDRVLDVSSIAGIIRNIAIAIALIIPCVLSYYEARHQGPVWFTLWVIAIILVVVFYIWGVFF